MSRASSTMRGRPIATFALLATVWLSGRALWWENPFANLQTPVILADGGRAVPATATVRAVEGRAIPLAPVANVVGRAETQSAATAQRAKVLAAPPASDPARMAPPSAQVGAAGGHQLLWMAAMSHLPVPAEIAEQRQRTGDDAAVVQPASPLALASPSPADRWSLDAWAFWREGSDDNAIGAGRVPIYGASQAGAVLAYRLGPDSGRDPRAYLRAYRALVTNGETELAAGLSARPLAGLPLRAHAELRATRRGDGREELRPGIMVTSEIVPQKLPLAARGEIYAQAGYVGGDNPTAFADGQLHLLRDLARFDLGRLSLGAAAWGGAQEDAHRLDLGPSLRFDARLGEVPARLSLDYRERVAGDAQPPSGVALTLSSGF